MARGIGIGQGLNAFAQGAAQGLAFMNALDERKNLAEDRALARVDRERRIAQEDEQLVNQREDRQREEQARDVAAAIAAYQEGIQPSEQDRQRLAGMGIELDKHGDPEKLSQWTGAAQRALSGQLSPNAPEFLAAANWRLSSRIKRGIGEALSTDQVAEDGTPIPAGAKIVDKELLGFTGVRGSGDSIAMGLRVTVQLPDGNLKTYRAMATDGRNADPAAGVLGVPLRQLIEMAHGDVLISDAWGQPDFQSAIKRLRAKYVGLTGKPIEADDRTDTVKEFEYAKRNLAYTGSLTDWMRDKGSSGGPTASQREYQQAKADGFDGTFWDFISRPQRAPALINIGGAYVDPSGARAPIEKTLPPGDRPETKAAQAEATAAGKARGEFTGEQEKKGAQSADTLRLLDEIEKLLPAATGSGVGALRDKTGNLIGRSSKAADAAAQLETLAPQLILKIPRMEGPQSDRDAQLYREAAGRLGDRTIPVAQRMAALQTLRELNMKYAGHSTGGAQASRTIARTGRLPDGRRVVQYSDGSTEVQ